MGGVTVAKYFSAHCKRCYRPIKVGDPIEEIPAVPAPIWVHVGCQDVRMNRRIGSSDSAGSQIDIPALMHEVDRRVVQEVERRCVEVADQLRLTFRKELKAAKASPVADSKADVYIGQPPEAVKVPLGDGVRHSAFERALKLAIAGKPIFLPGPAGCGKTHLAVQLSQALMAVDSNKWGNFGVFTCTAGMTEADLVGTAVPNVSTGELAYMETDFVRCYERGGVFCLDEMDAGDANVLLKLNAPIAQGILPIPKRVANPVAKRHPGFVLVATANTVGRGADREYAGRCPIDEATLDRFRYGTIPCEYDERVEREICPDHELFHLVQKWRSAMFEAKIRRIISTRFLKDAFDMVQLGDTIADVKRALFSTWRPEEQVKVLGRTLSEDLSHE